MIVKVQLSLATSHNKRQVMIYDQSQRHCYQGDASVDVIAVMCGRPKVFFNATLEGNEFILFDEAPWQEW